MVFDFTSQTYQVLHYGNALGNIWEEHRAAIEPKLRAVGLAQHLTAIDSGLQSDNKEHWRMAVYECRSLLTDLADALWRDPQATYEFLPGDGKGGKLDVTHDKVANRFGAYLHQKGIYSSSGALLRSEMDRLFDSLRQVLGAEGKAHAPMSREDARSVAILTYLLIGELAIRTDFQPVRTYSAPAS